LPKRVTEIITGLNDDFRQLDAVLGTLSPDFVRVPLAFGTATAAVIAVIFGFSVFGDFFCQSSYEQDLPCLVFLKLMIGLISCVTFLIPTAMISIVHAKLNDFKPDILVTKGAVHDHCVGVFSSALVMTLLTAFTRLVIERYFP
jgi:hypothetical protein